MKVTLIDYTGCGSIDPWYAARLLIYAKNTRVEQGIKHRVKTAMMEAHEIIDELNKIANTIRSSWEFVTFTFEILDVTRAFTHQLVRTRHGSYAQQAQRVVDMRAFGSLLPQTVKDKELEADWLAHMSDVSDFYADMIDAGIPAQDARGVLPTNIYTNILAQFNLRTFAELCGKRDNLRAQGEYADVVRAMKAEAYNRMPWLAPFLEPERTKTPVLEAILKKILDGKSPVDVPQVNDALKELDKLKGTWG